MLEVVDLAAEKRGYFSDVIMMLYLRLGLGPQVPEVEEEVAHEGGVGDLVGEGRVVDGGRERGVEAAGNWSGNSRQHFLKVAKLAMCGIFFHNGQLFNDNKCGISRKEREIIRGSYEISLKVRKFVGRFF